MVGLTNYVALLIAALRLAAREPFHLMRANSSRYRESPVSLNIAKRLDCVCL